MSGLDILGGLGKGVMIGADQIRRQEAHDAGLAQADRQMALQEQQLAQNKAYNDARLSMAEEDQTWQREDRATKTAETQRVTALQKLRLGIEQNNPNLPDHEKENLFLTEGVRGGLFRPEEIQAAKTARDNLYQNFGVEAVDSAVFAGDVTKLQRIASTKFPGMQIALAGDKFQITKPDGKTEPMSRSAVGQMLQLTKVVDQEAAREKERLAGEKTRSEIKENNAQAGASSAQAAKASAEARGQTLENEGLSSLTPQQRLTRGKNGSGGAQELQIAQWLIDNKVAANPTEAWDLVRTAKGRSRDDAIAGIYTRMQADPLNAGKDPKVLVHQATAAYDAITGGGEKPATGPARDKATGLPVVSSPEEARRLVASGALKPGDLFVTSTGEQRRVGK